MVRKEKTNKQLIDETKAIFENAGITDYRIKVGKKIVKKGNVPIIKDSDE